MLFNCLAVPMPSTLSAAEWPLDFGCCGQQAAAVVLLDGVQKPVEAKRRAAISAPVARQKPMQRRLKRAKRSKK